jgi:integrase
MKPGLRVPFLLNHDSPASLYALQIDAAWQRSLHALFKLAGLANGYAHRFRDTFSVELLLAGVPIEQVSILLGHRNIKITQQHYSPWVRDRQRQLEADLERARNRDPLVLLEQENRRKNASLQTSLPN